MHWSYLLICLRIPSELEIELKCLFLSFPLFTVHNILGHLKSPSFADKSSVAFSRLTISRLVYIVATQETKHVHSPRILHCAFVQPYLECISKAVFTALRASLKVDAGLGKGHAFLWRVHKPSSTCFDGENEYLTGFDFGVFQDFLMLTL